ncbi:MAG: GIY-YIG nuclease family protein [Bacteroidales bacterium]|nr:GIY-YIG nuclease family protein [Bacteroidales bacterium]
MFAIIDIETTGGSAVNEKVTEIAIYIHDGQKVIAEYSTLVNPEKKIPPFITRLTGISDEMVLNAPKFYEVAKNIIEITKDCIFVAHNAIFDYSFIRHEFLNLGYKYYRPTLCTVKLSRKLLPGFTSYSLGNLCESLDIRIENRHRAAGDALATVKVFEKLLEADPTLNGVNPQILNPSLNKSVFSRIPHSPGVYYFHDDSGKIIYIGKSKDIRTRILSHFTNTQSPKTFEMTGRIADISFEETGSELIALLLESDEIKKHLPLFNRLQRRTLYKYGLNTYLNHAGYLNLQVSKLTPSSNPITVFLSLNEANNTLHQLVTKFQLCQKLSGLYQSQGACFHHSIGQCNGACIGAESPDAYNVRVNAALAFYEHPWKNVLIIDNGRNEDEKSAILIENGKYTGFGWFEKNGSTYQKDIILDCIKRYQDNRDIQQIIRQYTRTRRGLKFIKF